MSIHYLEFVTPEAEACCAALTAALGLSFGEAVAELGHARVARGPDGVLVGVRAPLAAHEAPVVRTYFSVDDIEAAVARAEAAGAKLAYGPTRQGDTGTWAICILGGVQVGFWQA